MVLLHDFSDSFCHAVSQRWRGTNHLLFQASPETCLSCCCCRHLAKGVIRAAHIPAVQLSVRGWVGCDSGGFFIPTSHLGDRPHCKCVLQLAAAVPFLCGFCCHVHHGSCRCCKSCSGCVWWSHPGAYGALRSVEVLVRTSQEMVGITASVVSHLISPLVTRMQSANR